MEPRWTYHAAKRVLQRGLDPHRVLALARGAISAGLVEEPELEVYVEHGRLGIVMCRNVIITVYQVQPVAPIRKPNRRYKSSRLPAV